VRRRFVNVASAVVAIGLTAPQIARAQDGSRRWEIEFVGGASVIGGGRTGALAVPPPGPAIITNGPLSPSRAVPSWFFGDGTTIVNAVATEFGLVSRLAPLEDAFADGASISGGALFGVRARRPIAVRWAIEGGVTFGISGASFGDDALAAIELTRAGFEATLTELLQTGPLANVVVSATRSAVDGGARSLVLTGALVYDFAPAGAFVPYVIAGGGMVAGGGSARLDLDGRYAFDVAVPGQPGLAIDESDRVTLRLDTRPVPVAVGGAGVRRALSDRWTLRLDARVFVGPNATRVRLDATPAIASPGPAGFIEIPTNPSIQFSSDPETGRQSTLSGEPVRGFDLFVGGGLQTRVQITVGVGVRF
jgi:hypothetical protein